MRRKNPHAVALGRLGGAKGGPIGGLSRSEAKVTAAKMNATRAGRPLHAWGRCALRSEQPKHGGRPMPHNCMGRCRKTPPCRCAWCEIKRQVVCLKG